MSHRAQKHSFVVAFKTGETCYATPPFCFLRQRTGNLAAGVGATARPVLDSCLRAMASS